jgi:hypothetical protein
VPVLEAEEEARPAVNVRKSCCFVFSLQTGVSIIFFFDLSLLTLLCFLYGLTYSDGTVDTLSELDIDIVTINKNGFFFNLMTDGLLIALYLMKVFYGFKYLRIVYFLPKMEYQYLEDNGDLRWHTRRVKKMRIAFKNYFLVSAVATVFILLQTTLLLFVIYKDADAFLRYVILMLNAMLQVYLLLSPIKDHIKELDEQVTYRIKRYTRASEDKKTQKELV